MIHTHIHKVVCSNREAQKRPAESNGTPAMDLGHMNVLLEVVFMCVGSGFRDCNYWYYYCLIYFWFFLVLVFFFLFSLLL